MQKKGIFIVIIIKNLSVLTVVLGVWCRIAFWHFSKQHGLAEAVQYLENPATVSKAKCRLFHRIGG